jgi:hypothetical protein
VVQTSVFAPVHTRPGNPDEKELRQRRRDKDEDGRLPVLEKAAGGLAHEARGEHEGHREQSQVDEPAERREAVDPRQDDEKKRQRGDVDRQVR